MDDVDKQKELTCIIFFSWLKTQKEDEDEEAYDKISESERETSSTVAPPHKLLIFQTIRSVKADEVPTITKQLQRVDEFTASE